MSVIYECDGIYRLTDTAYTVEITPTVAHNYDPVGNRW